jgi:hypothetical protein
VTFAPISSLFMSMGRNYVSELRPPTGLLFTPQMIYEYEEPRWNNIDMRNLKNSEKDLSQSYFIHHKSHTDGPVRVPGPPRWGPATSRLSHGTAIFHAQNTSIVPRCMKRVCTDFSQTTGLVVQLWYLLLNKRQRMWFLTPYSISILELAPSTIYVYLYLECVNIRRIGKNTSK